MKIKLGTRYETKGGHHVRIYAVDVKGNSATHGAWLDSTGWEIIEWTKFGQAAFYLEEDGDLDLKEIEG